MTSIAQDVSDTSEDDTEWGWDAMKNWWNPASNKKCKKAEKKLVNQFMDHSVYEYQSRQIPIDYDPEPLSIKQRKSHRSNSWSLFSFAKSDNSQTHHSRAQSQHMSTATMSTSAIPTHYQQLKPRNSTMKEYIHTLTFRVKTDKLQTLMGTITNQNEYIDSDEECYLPISTENELKNDGNTIEYESAPNGQSGSSSYHLLQKQLNQTKTKELDSIAPIVLTHGYGIGGGMFIPAITKIYNGLLSHIKVKHSPTIHVIDWLGNGMSSRPEFQCSNTAESEDWFVDSLEQWRKAMNIEKMILSGHSLGGYMCAVYAMRYPQCVEHLILVSPVGFPARPKESVEKMQNYSWKVRTMFKTFGKLWNSGWTPHDIIRFTGPKGKDLIEKLVQKRLFRIEDNNPLKPLLAEYLFHVVAQPGSGEYALNKILQPGAWAYNPLVDRIGVLKTYQNCADEITVEEKGNDSEVSSMKIDFVYGETDWMTSAHAVQLKQRNVINCEVYVTPECGHQLILENGEAFGQLFGAIVAKGQILSS